MLKVSFEKSLKNYTLHIDLSVGEEIITLVGPSGSGKTTILNCIAGVSHPDEGIIQLNDKVLYETSKKPLAIQKRNIGYLFQDYALFPHMTVEKNIQYGLKDYKLVEKLIDIVGIKPLMDSYPHQISGGEKQRVALVRALATKPDALLLDEPFSALDEKTRVECQDELLRIHEEWKIPIILVTHHMEEAKKMGNRKIQLNKGKII
ncbi:sulfate/molybdate ABC transporter ATP-binding protein [Ornithinibacillus halophilus]|uniref:sulfate/molybdate ABC transporter ATP-binding protein n=1 Tax=Ornithinibacillus halophilus TaxID=930117 RepID=UPI0009355094|nr:ATP-binding cassette domain-containing protein [Ornithinibacillus halophilus]